MRRAASESKPILPQARLDSGRVGTFAERVAEFARYCRMGQSLDASPKTLDRLLADAVGTLQLDDPSVELTFEAIPQVDSPNTGATELGSTIGSVPLPPTPALQRIYLNRTPPDGNLHIERIAIGVLELQQTHLGTLKAPHTIADELQTMLARRSG